MWHGAAQGGAMPPLAPAADQRICTVPLTVM